MSISELPQFNLVHGFVELAFNRAESHEGHQSPWLLLLEKLLPLRQSLYSAVTQFCLLLSVVL